MSYDIIEKIKENDRTFMYSQLYITNYYELLLIITNYY